MPAPFTSFDRSAALRRLEEEHFDVLVIGGGITGAGVALDAAARGLATALVEKDDFASGTSSKSSKMVHGGLRYLQQKEFALVHENLLERQRLLHNAPHLVEPLPFLVPLFGRGGLADKTIVRGYSIALSSYDMAGGWRIGHRHKKVSADELATHLPTIDRKKLVAGFVYYDARADDARLTLAVVRTAVLDHGAVAANRARADRLVLSREGRITGAVVRAGDEELRVGAGVVVNAAGVWADDVGALEGATQPRSLTPAKGVHLMLSQAKLPCDAAAVIPVRGDRRSVFVVPWGDRTYVGTTDTAYDGPLDEPQVDDADVDYLLDAINAVVTEPVGRADVLGAWAGLRPLLARAGGASRALSDRTADLSRRHKVSVSAGGLVTITGGKLTTYRKMAEDAVDAASRSMRWNLPPSPTKRLRLRGSGGAEHLRDSAAAIEHRVPDSVLSHLKGRYGSESAAVLGLAASDASLLEPLVPGLAYLRAEAVYAVRYEMAGNLDDVLSRRTRATLLDAPATGRAARAVAGLIAPELGWDSKVAHEQSALFTASIEHELGAARAHGTGCR